MGHVAGAETGRGQRVAEAPEVLVGALGIVDGAGRHEDAGQLAGIDRGEAGEGRLLGLGGRERVLAGDRDAQQVVEPVDGGRVDAGGLERAAGPRGAGEGVGHGAAEALALVRAPLLGGLALDRRDRGCGKGGAWALGSLVGTNVPWCGSCAA